MGKRVTWKTRAVSISRKHTENTSEFFAKHFVDRNRILDEESVKKELANEADKLRVKDSFEESSKPHRRRRAHWSNYRPLGAAEVGRISSFEKLSRMLANEVHLYAKGGDKGRVDMFESQLSDLLVPSGDVCSKEMVGIVKCIYQLSIVDSITPGLISRLLGKIEIKQLKPRNVVYLLEALSRLRFRDHRVLDYVDSISLCWPTFQKNELFLIVKAANAIARLDVGRSSPFLGGLVGSFSEILPLLSRVQLERIKAVTVVELFDDLMLIDYFVLCEARKIEYRRSLILVFLKFRSRADLMKKVPLPVREWIEEIVRTDAEIRRSSVASSNEEIVWSSPLHREVAEAVPEAVPCRVCGPLVLDLVFPNKNSFAIEACDKYQFYRQTRKLTSEARLRHELIRSLGFELFLIPYFEWRTNQAQILQKIPRK